MTIIVKTSSPSGLLRKIKKAIDDNEVRSWSYDNDGDFTHDSEQWSRKAWLSPKVEDGELRLKIIPPEDVTISSQVYGLYHGRFIDMLLTHFHSEFVTATATTP